MERTRARTLRTVVLLVVIAVTIVLLAAAGPSLMDTIIRLHSR